MKLTTSVVNEKLETKNLSFWIWMLFVIPEPWKNETLFLIHALLSKTNSDSYLKWVNFTSLLRNEIGDNHQRPWNSTEKRKSFPSKKILNQIHEDIIKKFRSILNQYVYSDEQRNMTQRQACQGDETAVCFVYTDASGFF